MGDFYVSLGSVHAALAMTSHLYSPLPLSTAPRLHFPRQRQRLWASPSARRTMGTTSAVAEATKPLTKADLVAYLASGCKTRDRWR